MPKSYRIRTQPGVDKSIKIQLDQDFDFLEILSLKILQSDLYTRVCSDYGVVVGRVLVNGGFGVPNAKVSIFIPITEEDQNNPIISELYPYTSLDDVNEDGYRYNLLPYQPSYEGHASTGTFPSREDVLTNSPLVEVYDKYYKFTVKTNESGDYMIFGVPTGTQTVFMDIDLSDIGCFSLSPQDLIAAGIATESQVDGNRFRTSTNLRELPQIVSLNKIIEVQPLWGEPEICLLGITRVDFDLTSSANVNIQPSAVFMGSIFSTPEEDSVKKSCKPKINTGNMCDLVAGPGQILALRHTVNADENGDPILEQYRLEEDGKVIDGEGTWMVTLPMNLDYVTTNEFGEQVISTDPTIGIPTKGRYRFKIKWQNEQGLQNNFMRGNFLVPNVKEYGWDENDPDTDPFNPDSATGITVPISAGTTSQTITLPQGGFIVNNFVNTQQLNITINGIPYYGGIDSIPLTGVTNTVVVSAIPIDNTQDINFNITFFPEQYFQVLKSYAFSLDWDDYVNKDAAINCEDTFYEFNYNKIYTVSGFIDRFKCGKNRARHLGIKEITNRTCQSENNKLPVNDLQRNFDFIFFLFTLLLTIVSPMIVVIIIVNHVLAFIYPIVVAIVNFIANLVNGIIYNICKLVKKDENELSCNKEVITPLSDENPFKRLGLPMITYPDCEVCSCPDESLNTSNSVAGSLLLATLNNNVSLLSDIEEPTSFTWEDSGVGYIGCITSTNDTLAYDLGGRQQFTGVVNNEKKFYKVPMREIPSPSVGGNPELYKFFGQGITLAQSLNNANLRSKYFDSPIFGATRNRITITPNPSIVGATTLGNGGNSYQDIAMIIAVDPGTTQQLEGKLICFNNPITSNDPNVTGGTQNQFGSTTVTGTTVIGNGVSTLPVTYAKSDGTGSWTANITVVSTQTEKEYVYKSGIEYFQVVKGYRWDEIIPTSAPFAIQPNSLLHRHLKNNLTQIGPNGNPSSFTPHYFWFDQWETHEILILVRGVDPYSERQEIKYDLSELFGVPTGTYTVTGEYFLNIPIKENSGPSNTIWYDTFRTPEPHNYTTNNTNTVLYHQPYNFIVDTTAYSAFTTTSPLYYSATDKSWRSFVYGAGDSFALGDWLNPASMELFNTGTQTNTLFQAGSVGSSIQAYTIGNIEGGSFTVHNASFSLCYSTFGNPATFDFVNARCYSPSYHIAYPYAPINHTPTPHTILPNNRLVFRSDRLPTSDVVDRNLQTNLSASRNSYPLHQNRKFSFFSLESDGTLVAFTAVGDLGTGNTATIVNSFSCEGMVPLKCYQGVGNSFGVVDPCVFNETGTNGVNKRVNGGCYYFVDDKLIKTIKDDIQYLAEWRIRFRILFGACRGVFGHMFQNNWLNGSLYMPSFNKQTTYNIFGIPNYKYCKQLVVFNDITNNFYYRSSPYDSNSDKFIGAPPPSIDNFFTNLFNINTSDNSQNDRQILFPTTIMDMGNRDEFITSICSDPDFVGKYLGNTFRSTSYQDSSDVLQLSIISRIINSTFLEQVLSINNAGVEQFFTRTGDRIDGDIAQSFSINSEYQVTPFIGGNYPDDYVWISSDNSGEPVFGIFYQTNQEEYRNRRALSPGYNIYSFATTVPLQTYYGYPKTQDVPMYRWNISPQNATNNSIFGNQFNNWWTQPNLSTGFYVSGYQDLDAVSSAYFKTNQMSQTFPNIYNGFITNFNPTPPPDTVGSVPPVSVLFPFPDKSIVVGAPYFFYFGLKNGKTAMNRFIKTYINTEFE